MSKFSKVISIASTAAAMSVVMAGSMASAQEAADNDQDQHANDAYKANSSMSHDTTTHDDMQREVRQMTSTYGIESLNDIEDWKVVNNGEELGSIDRIGVDRKTGEVLAVVGLKGVLGANMKEVAIPLKQLKKSGDESLSTTLTKDQLQQKRDIDPWTDTHSSLDDVDDTN